MAFETGVVTWVKTHLKHHALSDQKGKDPHTPLDGFIHAHLGWIIDGWYVEPTYGEWLDHDRVAQFFEKTFVFWSALGLFIPFVLGYWWTGSLHGAFTAFLWGGLVRVCLVHHVTWSVNSICHTFGSQDYHTKDESRNNLLVGLFALGEGWHNNHHAFTNSPFHGQEWWQVDISGYFIRALARMGLVWELRVPTLEQIARKRV